MKIKDLITKLQAFDPDMNICLFDYKVNMNDCDSDGSTAGIFPEFDIAIMGKDAIPKGSKPWVAIDVNNELLNDDGGLILPYNDNYILTKAAEEYPARPANQQLLESLKWTAYINHLRMAFLKGYKSAFAKEEE